MQEDKNLSEIEIEDQKIIENKELNIWEAIFPIIALVAMLAFNVFVFGDDALSGSNQFIL
jgi:NhaC family Na+:H+ antiporter